LAGASLAVSPPSGRPVILDHVDHSNVLNPILLEKGIRSLVGVPLLVHGAVIGVLHVGTVQQPGPAG
jgi:GAF domain-containing protein